MKIGPYEFKRTEDIERTIQERIDEGCEANAEFLRDHIDGEINNHLSEEMLLPAQVEELREEESALSNEIEQKKILLEELNREIKSLGYNTLAELLERKAALREEIAENAIKQTQAAHAYSYPTSWGAGSICTYAPMHFGR